MKKLMAFGLAATLAMSGAAFAAGKSESAPGQDRTCLITFKKPVSSYSGGNYPNVDITDTKYLPRKAANKQASKNPNMKTFDYPATGTEETCSKLDPA